MTRRRLLLVAGWLAGGVVAGWLTPTGPRDGWQPPAGDGWIGILADGRTAVTASNESVGPIRLWDVVTGDPQGRFLAAGEPFMAACVVPGTDWVCVSSETPVGPPPPGPTVDDGSRAVRSATVYAARTGTVVRTLAAGFGVSESAFAAGGRVVAVGYPRRVELRTLPAGDLLTTVPDADGAVVAATGTAAVCLQRGLFVAFDPATGRELSRFDPVAATTWPVSFSPDGALLLDGTNVVWDVATGSERYRLPKSPPGTVVWSADGRSVLAVTTVGRDTVVEAFDAATGNRRPERRRKLSDSDNPGGELEPSHDGRWVVARGATDPRMPTPPEVWLSPLPGLAHLGLPRFRAV